MCLLKNCVVSALLVTCVSSLIVPDEITSLLSLVYSNIPPIKKGTDSRVGVGFRLGPYADFQVQLELGPQSNTQPIGPSADSKRRRNSEHPARDEALRDPALRVASVGNAVPGSNNVLPTTWLSKWRSALRGDTKVTRRASEIPKEVAKKSPLKMPSENNPEVVAHLSQLFAKNETVKPLADRVASASS